MFSNIFSWDNNNGPWGKPGGKKPSSRRTNPGSDNPDIDDIFKGAQNKMRGMMGNGNNGGNGKFVGLLAVAAGVLWLGSGFYIVAPEEKGVVLRFGEYVQTTDSGLHYHLPWPVETVIKPKVTRENVIEVGMRSGAAFNNRFGRQSARTGQDVPAESLMLTGDENIVDLDFTVRWRIADPRDFLFNVAGPVGLIKNAAESVMREVIGRNPIDDALTNNKAKIQNEARTMLQAMLDDYKSGVAITGVELQQVNPPAEVIDAFRDVQAARADAEKMQNEALGYKNDIIPRARGEAAQILKEAEAYKEAQVSKATGEADRFESQLAEYRKAKEVTARRLYIEAMEDVLKGSNKVILSGEQGQGVLPYLPLNEMKKGGK